MKKRFLSIASLTMAAVLSIAPLTAYAGEWQNDENGWKYMNDDGTYAANQWIRDEKTTKQYYIAENGYMMADTKTPDGYFVDASGAWIKDAGTANYQHCFTKEQSNVVYVVLYNDELNYPSGIKCAVNKIELDNAGDLFVELQYKEKTDATGTGSDYANAKKTVSRSERTEAPENVILLHPTPSSPVKKYGLFRKTDNITKVVIELGDEMPAVQAEQ